MIKVPKTWFDFNSPWKADDDPYNAQVTYIIPVQNDDVHQQNTIRFNQFFQIFCLVDDLWWKARRSHPERFNISSYFILCYCFHRQNISESEQFCSKDQQPTLLLILFICIFDILHKTETVIWAINLLRVSREFSFFWSSSRL